MILKMLGANRCARWLAIVIVLVCTTMSTSAQDTPVYPTAILPFQERGKDVSELGSKVTDILFALLVAEPKLVLVEREYLNKVLDEQELNLSGVVNPSATARVGQLTGAKILVTGSVLQSEDSLYLIAKVIGSETGRVLGASVKGTVRDSLDALVRELAKKLGDVIEARASELVAKPTNRADRLSKLREAIGKSQLPSIEIKVAERHIGQSTVDPAAATELEFLFTELGGAVIESPAAIPSVEVVIQGEGFSEFAARHGNLVSVKARLELKAVERSSGRILFADRQVAVAVDLSEQIAGKAALQEAASQMAMRLIPALANVTKEKK